MKNKLKILCWFLVFALIPLNNGWVLAQEGVTKEPTTPAPAVTKVTEAEKGLISVHFSNVDIQTALKVLAMKGGVNIVASPSVQGKVTIDLESVNWKNVLDLIVRNYGYAYVEDGNIIQVYSSETVTPEKGPEDVSSEAITLEYASLDQVKTALSKVLSTSSPVEAIKGSNQILVRGNAAELRKARNLIAQIDRRLPQVHVDAKIIRTSLTRDESMGVNWSVIAKFAGAKRPTTMPFAWDAAKRGPDSKLKSARLFPVGQTSTLATTTSTATGATATSEEVDFPQDYSFPFVTAEEFVFGTLDFTQFTAIMSFIKKRRNTKMISNPKITVLNHQDAKVRVGGQVGIPTFERNEQTGSFEITGYEERDEGITLTVSPHITKDDLIDVKVLPEISRYLGCEPMPGTTACTPRFDNTVADTRVLVRNGDTLMIGGFITDDDEADRNKVPFLNRIPIVGWIFKSLQTNTNKIEIVFFITVNVVDDVFSEKAVADWQKSEAEYEKFRKYTEEEFFRKRDKKSKPKKQLEVKGEAVPREEPKP